MTERQSEEGERESDTDFAESESESERGQERGRESETERERERVNLQLQVFLLGTLDPHSPLRILRGQGDVMRMIWTRACEEYWSLHIDAYQPKIYRFPGDNVIHDSEHLTALSALRQVRPRTHIPNLTHAIERRKREWDAPKGPDLVYSGVPMAIVAEKMSFPPRIASKADFLASLRHKKVKAIEGEMARVSLAETEESADSGEDSLAAHLRCWHDADPATTAETGTGAGLHINMMPFDLRCPLSTLPDYCLSY